MYRTRYKGMMLYLADCYDICKRFLFSSPKKFNTVITTSTFFLRLSVCLRWWNLNGNMTEVSDFLQGSISCRNEVPFHGVHILFPRRLARGQGSRSRRLSRVYPLIRQSFFLFKIFLKYKKENQKHVLWGEVFFYLLFLHCPFKG